MNILYSDGNIQLDLLDNGNYRVTLFKNCHWHGDFEFDLNGIKIDNLTEDDDMLHDKFGM